jgi:hypothetical protein
MKMLTKTRHNKKRNTAFIYEALVRELTKSIVSKDIERKQVIISLVREHFAKGTVLREELDLYKALYETSSLEQRTSEKLIYEVKHAHSMLDREQIFKEQTALINKINRGLSREVFSNFVPNYKSLATIYQILNPDVSVKHRVLLENNLIQTLSAPQEPAQKEMAPIDNLVYKTFVKKFNEQYQGKLLERQEHLLSRYIASFHDGGAELKIFLNEEIGRLKDVVQESLENEEIKEDSMLTKSAQRVLTILESYKAAEISEDLVRQVLKMQKLAKELEG